MTLRKDAMEILRVFNNNVVLAKGGDGGEVILTGRGLGFQAKPGQTVDESKVVRTFVPSDGRDPDHLGADAGGHSARNHPRGRRIHAGSRTGGA